MLEGSEIDEPMTLTQVVTRFTLRDMMERGESEEEADQVQLMTLHALERAGVPLCLSGGDGMPKSVSHRRGQANVANIRAMLAKAKEKG